MKRNRNKDEKPRLMFLMFIDVNDRKSRFCETIIKSNQTHFEVLFLLKVIFLLKHFH